MKFQEMLEIPDVGQRWDRVRRFFFLRESTYDMTRNCNLRCKGCYYYRGDKSKTRDETDPEKWKALFMSEKDRGITYVVLAGAEPSLVPELCSAAFDVIPIGCIATNGLEKIPETVGYNIHVSVWGNDRESETVRGAVCLERQLANYAADPRAVFIYTFTGRNIKQAEEVAVDILDRGGKLSFNQFSAPVGYKGDLRLNDRDRRAMAEVMGELLRAYPDRVLYSPYSIDVHSGERSLHQRFGCPYPRRNPNAVIGLGKSFRQYRTDLTWDMGAACCVPDTDCDDCRHYAAGSAIVTSRLKQHVDCLDDFLAWLDYVDTYLSVWVRGYTRSPNPAP